MVLRTITNSTDNREKPVYLHFKTPNKKQIKPDFINVNLDKVMQNMGREHFTYEIFKSAYDEDERVKQMVSDFNKNGAILKKTNEVDVPEPTQGDDGTVAAMARNAVDLDKKL